jgi:FkbM family methyltransferase
VNVIAREGVTREPAGSRVVRRIATALPHFRGRDRILLLVARALGGPWADRVAYRWPDGPEVLLNLNDIGQRCMYFFGRSELDLVWSIHNILRSGDIFIEAGTSVAVYTALAAAQVGPSGRVIGFEPLRAARQRAAEQISRNGFENVSLRDVALGEAAGEATVYLFNNLPIGHASLRQVSPGAFVADSCSVHKLDCELSPAERARVRLIKLDAEGSELLALRGAEQTIALSRPFVFVECNQTTMAGFNYGVRDLLDWLRDRDLICYQWICGTWRAIDDYTVPSETNLLAVPSERIAEFADLVARSS